MDDKDLFLRAFRFNLKLRRSPDERAGLSRTRESRAATGPISDAAFGDGAFQEVSGLEIELDIAEYLEGGRNDGVIRRLGRAKYVPLVLKRGMFYSPDGKLNRALWEWLQSISIGTLPVPRYDGIVEVWGKNEDEIVATWEFERGVPARVRGPELNAKTGEVAIEELHIAHEGLRLV